MTATTDAPVTARTTGRRQVRHFLEMMVAIFAGMLLLGMARDALGWTVRLTDRPGVWYLLMATDMAIGMAAWMSLRGCHWRHTLEMCAAMYAPLALLPLVWLGTMVLAMLAVVVWRPDHRS